MAGQERREFEKYLKFVTIKASWDQVLSAAVTLSACGKAQTL